MKTIIPLLLTLTCTSLAFGQKHSGPVFNSYIAGGVVIGKSQTAAAIQMVHGLTAGKYFIGAGIGYDWQPLRSRPVFISLRRSFTLGGLSLFAYADGGIHLPERIHDGHNPIARPPKPGLCTDAGIGYSIPVGKTKRQALFLTAGNSLKQYKVQYFNDGLGTNAGLLTERYSLSRITIRAGIKLW